MANLYLPTPTEQRTEAVDLTTTPGTDPAPHPNAPGFQTGRGTQGVLLIAGINDGLAADYAAYLTRKTIGELQVQIADLGSQTALSNLNSAISTAWVPALTLFLGSGHSNRSVLDALVRVASEKATCFVAIVSTFRAHLGESDSVDAESYLLGQLNELRIRAAVFRPGFVVSPNSRTSRSLRRWGFCAPLVPRRLRSCFVESEELFAAIENERQSLQHSRACSQTRFGNAGHRIYTLLGSNRPWQELLARHRTKGFAQAALMAVSAALALTLIGQIAGLVVDLLARFRPSLRCWNFDMLRPQSLRELLVLSNKYNYRHIKIVGYNNGVVHFGHSYSGRTVVSTTRCRRVIRLGAGMIKADCGATIRQALDFLAESDQELYVIPNYSYVCLGTSFFVPIHGSAVDYSTVAETITKVVLYDPVLDRLMVATPDEPAFRDHVYDQQSPILLLRLYLRVKPKSRYFVHKEQWQGPTGAELMSALQDNRATNVEIRKSNAKSPNVQISKYYKAANETPFQVLELPRDSLGRLWDKLEENAVTSFLMHALTRHFAWHVELFFSAAEFATFWESHHKLPLRKIQLRYIRRDGFPQSPFREHDCISVDMFMFRWRRHEFEAFLKLTFAVVRSNPGKHSQ
jgi:hypothetical protein